MPDAPPKEARIYDPEEFASAQELVPAKTEAAGIVAN